MSIPLPEPRLESAISLEQALRERRSIREFLDTPINLDTVGQLLWAAQGVTDNTGLRTAPSAGALYPLECYLLTGNVTGLAPGTYRYDPNQHRLEQLRPGDIRQRIAIAALDQSVIDSGAALLVITGVQQRTARKYGPRAERYVAMEAGHAAQNVLLQATVIGLGAVPVGAFNGRDISLLLGLPQGEAPLYLIPFGRPEK